MRVKEMVENISKRKQSSFFLDCDLRKRNFDQIGRNDRNLNRICKECFEFVLFCFFFLIWVLLKRRNVERDLKSACSQQFVKLEKEKKSVIFRICQTGWNSLTIGLAEWLKLVAIKQTTISTTTELDFLLLSASERNAVFSSFTNHRQDQNT